MSGSTRMEFHMNNAEIFMTSVPDEQVQAVQAALSNAKIRTLTVTGDPEAILLISNIAFVTFREGS